MAAFQNGAEGAFDALFERYREPIWRFFRRRLELPADAEECAQETFVALVRNVRRYTPGAPFRRYIFAIAFNISLAARRRALRPESPVPDGWDPPAASADPIVAMWVRDAIAALPTLDRDVLMLREYDQLDYAEIAHLTGVPIGTVRSRLFRARMALRVQLVGERVEGA